MKNLIIGALIGIIVGMLGTAYASNIGDNKKITIYTDEETKIQYIIIEAWKRQELELLFHSPATKVESFGKLHFM